MRTQPCSAVSLLLALLTSSALLGAGTSNAAMTGMITPVGDEGDTYVAYPVSLEPGGGVQSIRWYNNDGATALPSLSLVGEADGSPDLSTVYFTTTDVHASSDAWAQVDLPQIVGGSSLFVVFQLPTMARTAIGVGGGPGIGYEQVPAAPRVARISADGEEWVSLPATMALGVEAVLAPVGGMIQKGAATDGLNGPAKDTVVHRTALEAAYPNPANPSMRVKFSLGTPGDARVSVYNVRGQKVRTLVDRWLPIGEHQVQWLGTDDRGGSVSSGVYYVRFEANGVSERTRVALVR